MAQGDLICFDSFTEQVGAGTHNLATAGGDAIKVMLVSEAVSAIAAQTDSSQFTEVSGTGYTAGGAALTNAFSRSGGTSTYDSTADAAWTKNAAGPTNIKMAIIYNSAAASNDAIAYVDMTADGGTTAVSLQDGNVSLAWNASGLFDLTK